MVLIIDRTSSLSSIHWVNFNSVKNRHHHIRVRQILLTKHQLWKQLEPQSCSSHLILLYISRPKEPKAWTKEKMGKANFFRRGTVVLKHAVRVLLLRRSHLLPFSKMKPAAPPTTGGGYLSHELDEAEGIGVVPEDVKEGHFAVVAVFAEKPRRFVVSLSCLSHPMFLRLLELAEHEFGFRQEGALSIPCRPSDLERIIREL